MLYLTKVDDPIMPFCRLGSVGSENQILKHFRNGKDVRQENKTRRMPPGFEVVPEVPCHRLAFARDNDAALLLGPLENLSIVHAQGQVWPIANPEDKERLHAWPRVVSLNCLPEWTAQVFVKKERGGPVHGADFGDIALRR